MVSKSIDRQVRLPGELSPYLSVPIYARVAGFVDRVEVDRGSVVKKGQVLATLVAPETEAQIAEATSKARRFNCNAPRLPRNFQRRRAPTIA